MRAKSRKENSRGGGFRSDGNGRRARLRGSDQSGPGEACLIGKAGWPGAARKPNGKKDAGRREGGGMRIMLAKRAIVAAAMRTLGRRAVVPVAKLDIRTEHRAERAERRRGFCLRRARHRIGLDGGGELTDQRKDRDPDDKDRTNQRLRRAAAPAKS